MLKKYIHTYTLLIILVHEVLGKPPDPFIISFTPSTFLILNIEKFISFINNVVK